MSKRTDLSPVIDGLLRLIAAGSILSTMLIAPNALQLLDKPLQKFFKDMDERERQREMKRILSYMHRQGLVTDNYEHGLKISKKARARLKQAELNSVAIKRPLRWDGQWRIIFYDIPEKYKVGRDQLAWRLRLLGCQQLQRSVWIHPFPCGEEINAIALAYRLDRYITYLETRHINNEQALRKRFSHIL